MLKAAVFALDQCKEIVNKLGGPYKANFDTKYAEAGAMRDAMIKENKTVYYEAELPIDECPKPDANNFVSTQEPVNADKKSLINEPAPIDAQLRHLIPPAVRQNQEELKNVLQGIISEQFNKVQTANEQLNNFLKSMNLPMAV